MTQQKSTLQVNSSQRTRAYNELDNDVFTPAAGLLEYVEYITSRVGTIRLNNPYPLLIERVIITGNADNAFSLSYAGIQFINEAVVSETIYDINIHIQEEATLDISKLLAATLRIYAKRIALESVTI